MILVGNAEMSWWIIMGGVWLFYGTETMGLGFSMYFL
jgi:hypothetical protein